MKNLLQTTMIFLFFFLGVIFAFAEELKDDPNIVVEEMYAELETVSKSYSEKITFYNKKLQEIDIALIQEKNTERKLNLLLEKDMLKTNISNNLSDMSNEISKIRYIKGLQIIRILYEKVLGLDHHFSSVRTFSEISKISNPTQYPEFEKVQDLIKSKKDKKFGFDLTSILGTNSIASVINTFTSMLVSNLTKEEKESELKKVDCIIDFTLRMQNDLNTIYFETAFLQKSNDGIKKDIETLFRDYTKPIGYAKSLKECRENDDWSKVKDKLENYVLTIAKSENLQKRKMQIEVEFPIDRLIQFIGGYNNFINSGEQFYQKFSIILNSYQNQTPCESKLPIEYGKLKSDINIAIDKFNVAYKPVEVNGSKMKEILYGINEFQ